MLWRISIILKARRSKKKRGPAPHGHGCLLFFFRSSFFFLFHFARFSSTAEKCASKKSSVSSICQRQSLRQTFPLRISHPFYSGKSCASAPAPLSKSEVHITKRRNDVERENTKNPGYFPCKNICLNATTKPNAAAICVCQPKSSAAATANSTTMANHAIQTPPPTTGKRVWDVCSLCLK